MQGLQALNLVAKFLAYILETASLSLWYSKHRARGWSKVETQPKSDEWISQNVHPKVPTLKST